MFSIILEVLILVNLFLILCFALISHTVAFNPSFKGGISIVKLNGTPFELGKFDSDCGALHSVSIMLDLEPFVNGFLGIFGSFLWIF